MIPTSFTESEQHTLTEGRNKGAALSSLDDATLSNVITYYRSRDFHEWRAAYLVACARVLRAEGLLEAPKADIEAAARYAELPARAKAARWYLENFGSELL